MNGSSLSSGEYLRKDLNDDELWASFVNIFTTKSKNSSSYKYGFFKAITDNLYNVNESLYISLDKIFAKFAEIYWNLILKYELKQYTGKETNIEKILRDAASGFKIEEPIPYENLSDDIKEYVNKKVTKQCKIYVVGALYGDTNQLFYSFSKKEEWIQFNPVAYEFVCKYKSVLEKLNYYEWARFLEKVNEEEKLLKVLDKIELSSKRSDLSVYRKILYEEFEYNRCFYCGKELGRSKVHVDHFIPWSFIKDDNIWNFVLTCSKCNLSKNDRLPEEKYLDILIERNKTLIELIPTSMNSYRSRMLTYIYKWAKINGYDQLWSPK